MTLESDNITHEEFVVWFMNENKSLINRYIRKRLIPNRYSSSDVKSYIIERILDILKKRKAKDKSIEDPRLYFKKLLDFYCIEYQRMHGYIYAMPKRPRCPEAEEEISQYGFVYLQSDDSLSLDNIPQLGYIDGAIDENNTFTDNYQIKGVDPGKNSATWDKLMLMALPEDRKVLSCIFTRNMSVPEVSKHLGIAISTAYSRKERGIRTISGTLSSFVNLDKESWEILNNVEYLEDEVISITQFYNNLS